MAAVPWQPARITCGSRRTAFGRPSDSCCCASVPMRRTARKAGAIVFLAAAAGLLGASGSAAQGIHVALTPTEASVNAGDEFDLDITVTEAGLAFNGFDVVIGWDPAVLTPVSNGEGDLMTGACMNTFHHFVQAADRDTITDVLLCSGVELTGPGQIYRLRFKASTTPQTTQVTFLPGLQFYNQGLFINPAIATDAVIHIVQPVGVESTPSRRLKLSIAPNPGRGGTTFTVEADGAGTQRLRVVDARGKFVRSFDSGAGQAGARTIAWDGLDSSGRPSPAGVYLVTLEVAGQSVSKRICLIH